MKTVIIASGKGGTGKTTLTALFAHLAAREMTVVVGDADVEASNLPIALHAKRTECEDFSGGLTAHIDPARCRSCGLCADVCRFGALHADAKRGAFVVDSFTCEGCGACRRACSFDALEMGVSTAGHSCTGTSMVGPIAYGQLGPGEDLSGKLVTEVRGRAVTAAAEHTAGLMLIDGPPGIGCPVIAAMTNTDLLIAVAEPTVSGEHDLARLADLARRFSLPVTVVLNKADLSIPGAARIKALCDARGLNLIAEIPFDPTLAASLAHLATDDGDIDQQSESAGMRAVEQAWNALKLHLEPN